MKSKKILTVALLCMAAGSTLASTETGNAIEALFTGSQSLMTCYPCNYNDHGKAYPGHTYAKPGRHVTVCDPGPCS